MSRTIRNLFLFGAPLLVGVANLFHPVTHPRQPVYETIQGVAAWWTALHILNLFGFAFLGLSAFLLILERHDLAAAIAKIALLVFVPAYVGFDAVIGIGTANLVRYASALPVSQLPALTTAIQSFWENGVSTMLAIVGSVAWTVAMGASAVSFATARRGAAIGVAVLASAFTGWGYSSGLFGTLPWWLGLAAIALASALLIRPALPFALLILSGILFGTTHVVPFGPLGMAFLLAAAVTLRLPSRAASPSARAALARD